MSYNFTLIGSQFTTHISQLVCILKRMYCVTLMCLIHHIITHWTFGPTCRCTDYIADCVYSDIRTCALVSFGHKSQYTEHDWKCYTYMGLFERIHHVHLRNASFSGNVISEVNPNVCKRTDLCIPLT
jgi:hypothetical protein